MLGASLLLLLGVLGGNQGNRLGDDNDGWWPVVDHAEHPHIAYDTGVLPDSKQITDFLIADTARR